MLALLGPLALLAFAGPAAATDDTAVRVEAPWLACTSGKYAIVLPQHYPSLHKIGRHKVTDLEVQRRGAVTAVTRRLDYIGLRLEVIVYPGEPDRYQLLKAESTSRRWNIGPLSVGTSPWRWGREETLRKTPLEGPVRLIGHGESATLHLSGGRVERVVYLCAPPPP